MTSWKDRTEVSKNVLDVIKSAFILGIVIVLLFYSDVVNNLFDRYNVLQLEFGGIKMDRSQAIKQLKENADRLPQLEAQIVSAKVQFDQLQGRYMEATTALTALQKERDAAVERLKIAGQDSPSSLVNVQKILTEQIDTHALVDNAKALLQSAASTTANALANLPTAAPTGTEKFAIIVGSYPELAPAKAAIDATHRTNGIVFKRQNVFRTALRFPTEDAAKAQLSDAKKISSQAYIVNLASWCPKPVIDLPSVLDCQL